MVEFQIFNLALGLNDIQWPTGIIPASFVSTELYQKSTVIIRGYDVNV
jgi:hypothetical protein